MYYGQLPESLRPERAWLCLHQPVSRDQERGYEKVDSTIWSAWLLEHERIEERPVDVFARFAAAHIDRPWSAAEFDFPKSPMFNSRKHEFGLVRFAQFQESEYLLEMMWGGLNGRGLVVDTTGTIAKEVRELWRS
jgi:hypothetical protein